MQLSQAIWECNVVCLFPARDRYCPLDVSRCPRESHPGRPHIHRSHRFPESALCMVGVELHPESPSPVTELSRLGFSACAVLCEDGVPSRVQDAVLRDAVEAARLQRDDPSAPQSSSRSRTPRIAERGEEKEERTEEGKERRRRRDVAMRQRPSRPLEIDRRQKRSRHGAPSSAPPLLLFLLSLGRLSLSLYAAVRASLPLHLPRNPPALSPSLHPAARGCGGGLLNFSVLLSRSPLSILSVPQ